MLSQCSLLSGASDRGAGIRIVRVFASVMIGLSGWASHPRNGQLVANSVGQELSEPTAGSDP